MAKTVNLFGIRKKAILSRTKSICDYDFTVMIGITKEQEEELDTNEELMINNILIPKEKVYCYGQFDVNNEEDINYIEKFNIINLDSENIIHTDYNFEKGEGYITDRITKVNPTWDNIKWFKYNYLLIGKPERILIYKCKKHDL